MEKYHEKNNQRRAELQSRQFDELWALEKKLSYRSQQEETLVQHQYGDAANKLRNTIDDLSEKLEKPGFQGWWFRLRYGDETQHKIDMADKSLENLEWRIAERRDQYTFANVVDKELLIERHRRETEQLEQHIANPKSLENKKITKSLVNDRQIDMNYSQSMRSSLCHFKR